MKKAALFLTLILLLSCTILTVSAAPSASMSGPSTVRAGDTITVSFSAGGGILGGSGTVSYDSSLLTLKGYTATIGGSWAVEFSGNSFVFYDNTMASPINGSSQIFTATFQVSSSVAAGSNISVTASGVTLSDGTQDTSAGSARYSATIAPPLSSNCNLSVLTVSNATLSPAFSAGVTSYQVSVPYSTASLKLSATAADSKASVSINNPTLTPAATTTVSVTVTAENGATKTYSIKAARAQDPNYVKSNNANLGALSVDGFMLSPTFAADTDRYYVWLPYEVDSIAVKASADHSLASATVGELPELIPGKAADVAVTVTAEDGTQRQYTLTVFRAPAFEDTDAFLSGQRDTEPTEEPTEAVTETPTEPPTTVEPTVYEPEPRPTATEVGLPVVIAIACGCLALGMGVMYVIGKKLPSGSKGGSHDDESDIL